MPRLGLIAALAWGLLTLLPAASGAADPAGQASSPAASYEALLQQAQRARAEDPAAFAQLVPILEARIGEANREQSQLARYLSAHLVAFRGDHAKAHTMLESLYAEATDPVIRFRIGTLIANNLAITGGYSEGFRYLNESLPLLDQVSDPYLRNQGLNRLALFLNSAGDYQPGLEMAERVLAGAPTPRHQCAALGLRADANMHLGLAVDERELVDAIDHCTQAGEPIIANVVRNYLARMLQERDRRPEATVLLTRHLDEIQATHFPTLIGDTQARLAQLALRRGDRLEARARAEAAVATLGADATGEPLIRASLTLYEIAKAEGRIEEALAWYEKYSAAERSRLNDVRTRSLAAQQARFEHDLKNLQIDTLNKENEMLRLERELGRREVRDGQLLASLVVTLLGILLYWAWRVRHRPLPLDTQNHIDPATLASSRQHFTHTGESRLAAASLDGAPVSLVVIDLDQFKALNTRLGLAAGDWALKHLVEVLRTTVGPDCEVGRVDGDEFAVLLPSCERSIAAQHAEFWRQKLTEVDSSPSGYRFPLTASFGVADTEVAGYSFNTLFARAEELLHQSKRNGRNRVSVDPGPRSPDPGDKSWVHA